MHVSAWSGRHPHHADVRLQGVHVTDPAPPVPQHYPQRADQPLHGSPRPRLHQCVPGEWSRVASAWGKDGEWCREGWSD